MIKQLVEKYGVDYNNVRKMTATESVEYLVSQGFERVDVAYSFYKLFGWSDRMARLKAQNYVNGGYLL